MAIIDEGIEDGEAGMLENAGVASIIAGRTKCTQKTLRTGPSQPGGPAQAIIVLKRPSTG